MSYAKSILLVEDNEDDEIMTVRGLREGGFKGEIHVMRDGQEAIDWLTGHPVLPDLVLLDIRLPKCSGFDVLDTIRADVRLRNLAVVILTASSQQEDMVRSYELRANSYVRKPIQFADFRKVAQILGVYWIEYNLCPPPCS